MPSVLNVSADGVFVYCYKEPLTKKKKRYKLYLALKENEC